MSKINSYHDYELRNATEQMKESLEFAKGQGWDRLSVKMSRYVTDEIAEMLQGKGYNAKTFGGRVIVYLGGAE